MVRDAAWVPDERAVEAVLVVSGQEGDGAARVAHAVERIEEAGEGDRRALGLAVRVEDGVDVLKVEHLHAHARERMHVVHVRVHVRAASSDGAPAP